MMQLRLTAILLALSSAALSDQVPAGLGPLSVRLHDPSSIIRDGKTTWLFSTGAGINSHHTEDLEHWKRGPRVFDRPLPWFTDVAPTQKGHLWAPDIIKVGGRFLLYYSVSAFGKQTSAIALASSPTLNPESPDYHWKDHGIVIRSKPGEPYNAIDPDLMMDGTRLWMSYGSFWEGIALVELDPVTGMLKTPDSPPLHLASAPEIEAPFLHKHVGKYFLFVNWGLCCRGVKSTYEIRVGRADKVTGPYLDRNGNDLRDGGGSLLIGSRGAFVGPGHASIVTDMNGRERLACHYYDATRGGASFLALTPLRWTEDNWPEVPPLPLTYYLSNQGL